MKTEGEIVKPEKKGEGEGGRRCFSAKIAEGYSERQMDEELIVSKVLGELENRQADRRKFESKWLLNMNFLAGNQYHIITPRGDVEYEERNYAWESRDVFNHIAPIMETRLSKLCRLRPSMSVRSMTSSEDDVETAKLGTKILGGVMASRNLPALIQAANRWSEVTGTAFYKVVWDSRMGEDLATDGRETIRSGDISISVVSPFEIYPESAGVPSVESQNSIIHAKAYTAAEIMDIYGVEVAGNSLNIHTLENMSLGAACDARDSSSVLKDAALVVEKYERPTNELKNGRLTIVVGDKLYYTGDLPNCAGADGGRGYPFVKQIAIVSSCSFWGSSIIERLIPIQRAYNAVKNRKYEFMNRISMGILKVEDGSVDMDNLLEEGLTPGKVIVYRQGANPPAVMENFNIPIDLTREEDRLLNEFTVISGVSELMRSSRAYTDNVSGIALQIMAEQDDTRLMVTLDSLKNAVMEIAKLCLKLYKAYADAPRLMRISGERGVIESFYFSAGDMSSDDIVFDTESEMTESVAQRRSMAFDLLKSGLLTDENGVISGRMRAKMLEILGFGSWENSQDIAAMHISKAQFENLDPRKNVNLLDIDDHSIHIDEHTKHCLALQLKSRAEDAELIAGHIRAHKAMLAGERPADTLQGEV